MVASKTAKDALDIHLNELFQEELWEAGVRLARAVAAEALGQPEAAAVLRELATDEAKHAFWVSQLIAQEEIQDLRFNIQSAIEADSYAKGREEGFGLKAKDLGAKRLVKLFDQLSRDEQTHVEKLETLLRNLGN